MNFRELQTVTSKTTEMTKEILALILRMQALGVEQ
jgi:hypothetical protein